MLSHILTTLLSLASIASATDIPTLYLVGAGAVADYGVNNVTQGWGQHIKNYLHGLNINNQAKLDQTARSYREKYWDDVQKVLKSGDYVVIEFGHYEPTGALRGDDVSVPGEKEESQNQTLADGTVVAVYTWSHYIDDMIDGAIKKHATPIISSRTPGWPYFNGTVYGPPPFWVGYAERTAAARNVPYVDHYGDTLALYANLTEPVVENFFPEGTSDFTITSPLGALSLAKTFIQGLAKPAAKGVLSSYINPHAADITFDLNATKIAD